MSCDLYFLLIYILLEVLTPCILFWEVIKKYLLTNKCNEHNLNLEMPLLDSLHWNLFSYYVHNFKNIVEPRDLLSLQENNPIDVSEYCGQREWICLWTNLGGNDALALGSCACWYRVRKAPTVAYREGYSTWVEYYSMPYTVGYYIV
jgi:hypothetical protein